MEFEYNDDEIGLKFIEEAKDEPVDIEDDNEFIEDVKKFENKHKQSRLIKVIDVIGQKKIKRFSEIDRKNLKKELLSVLALLEKKNIFVHFRREYDDVVKYRFVTEEILNEDIEFKKRNKNHVNFIYEDYHPKLTEDEEE